MIKRFTKFGCNGGKDLDAYLRHKQRPFKHASTGRNNWRRKNEKQFRRAMDELAKQSQELKMGY